jgi:hypothetical protein
MVKMYTNVLLNLSILTIFCYFNSIKTSAPALIQTQKHLVSDAALVKALAIQHCVFVHDNIHVAVYIKCNGTIQDPMPAKIAIGTVKYPAASSKIFNYVTNSDTVYYYGYKVFVVEYYEKGVIVKEIMSFTPTQDDTEKEFLTLKNSYEAQPESERQHITEEKNKILHDAIADIAISVLGETKISDMPKLLKVLYNKPKN